MEISLEENDCCPSLSLSDDLNCDIHKECIVNCNRYSVCNNRILNASDASSLALYCDSIYQCEYLQVYCPKNNGSICNLRCNDNGCKYVALSLFDTYKVVIDCFGISSVYIFSLLDVL